MLVQQVWDFVDLALNAFNDVIDCQLVVYLVDFDADEPASPRVLEDLLLNLLFIHDRIRFNHEFFLIAPDAPELKVFVNKHDAPHEDVDQRTDNVFADANHEANNGEEPDTCGGLCAR